MPVQEKIVLARLSRRPSESRGVDSCDGVYAMRLVKRCPFMVHVCGQVEGCGQGGNIMCVGCSQNRRGNGGCTHSAETRVRRDVESTSKNSFSAVMTTDGFHMGRLAGASLIISIDCNTCLRHLGRHPQKEST